jgi:hypothetical protein
MNKKYLFGNQIVWMTNAQASSGTDWWMMKTDVTTQEGEIMKVELP